MKIYLYGASDDLVIVEGHDPFFELEGNFWNKVAVVFINSAPAFHVGFGSEWVIECVQDTPAFTYTIHRWEEDDLSPEMDFLINAMGMPEGTDIAVIEGDLTSVSVGDDRWARDA